MRTLSATSTSGDTAKVYVTTGSIRIVFRKEDDVELAVMTVDHTTTLDSLARVVGRMIFMMSDLGFAGGVRVIFYNHVMRRVQRLPSLHPSLVEWAHLPFDFTLPEREL